MKRNLRSLAFFFFILICLSGALFTSCSPTKHIAEGTYLLDKVEIKSDAKEIDKNDLPDFVRQTPNSYIVGLFRMQLGIYNLSGKDTTKWVNRILRRIGQPPVVLDSMLTDISSQQLLRYHINKGYYNAEINTIVHKKDKRARVVYQIQANKPYRVNNYEVDVPFHELEELAKDSSQSLIQKNMLFDSYQLDSERDRLSSGMRRRGYYNFMKDYMAYSADSAAHQVDVALRLRDYLEEYEDSLDQTVFKQYHISKVIFNLNPAISTIIVDDEPQKIDTLQIEDNYWVIGPKKKFLTFNSLKGSTFIKPGALFSDADVERTYAAFNALPPVKYTHISFTETATDSLQCLITVAEAKTFTFSSQAEITFTEGYWGTAGNVGVTHRNLFRGAESLTLQGRYALEKQGDLTAQEWGGQIGLRVPKTIIPFVNDEYSRSLRGSTEFKGLINYQYRPSEFTSTNIGFGTKYNWYKGRQLHNFDLLDVSYVYFPWISQEFKDAFLETGRYNRYNYEDYMIMRISYGTSFSGYNRARPLRNYFTYRYSIESAGNILYGIYKLLNLPAGEDGFYRTFNIPFSQYVQGRINSSYHQIIDKNNKFVYHVGLGVGYPYGNSEVIPFERRFYSGGANSVRGWGESRLGPGSYQRFTLNRRDYNQVGDIKLDMNVEYRTKMFWVLEGAVFADAGNIWTIRDYDYQPGGVFKLNTFWKQIALAYGIGIRMDFNFFIFRMDMGVKLYDPAVISASKWVLPSSFKNMAFHIAIGYPF